MFDSLHNFRDVGGCAAVDGSTVRTARLYRSDMLVKLSAEERPRFDRLGIRTVIDLRRPAEVAALGRLAGSAGLRYVNISPEHPLWEDLPFEETAEADRYLADRYAELADTGRRGIGQVINTIADDGSGPTVVHCFAGKDRTGVVVAVTLALLGVADDAIGDDYARSDRWVRTAAPADIPRHWVVAPRTAIMLFLAELRDRYGSVARYAKTAGVGPREVAALRTVLLAGQGLDLA